MTNGPIGHETSLQVQIEQYALERQAWVQEAADIFGGEANTPIESVFPLPMGNQNEARRDYPTPVLNATDEAASREIAGRFGIGGEQDVTLEAAGLPDGHAAIFEAGLIWKMEAEATMEDEGTSASVYIHVGSPHQVTSAKEREFQTEILGIDPANIALTQYEEAKLVAERRPGYVALPKPRKLPFGYTVDARHDLIIEDAPVDEADIEEKGQLVQIGTRNGKRVVLFRTDRENYTDPEDGKDKYRYQPDAAAIMGIVADVLTAQGDTDTAIGLATSNTYSSRVIDAVRAGLHRGRQFGVAMYGRNTLAKVKREPVASPTELMQIPGELRVAHFKLGQLLDELRHPEGEKS